MRHGIDVRGDVDKMDRPDSPATGGHGDVVLCGTIFAGPLLRLPMSRPASSTFGGIIEDRQSLAAQSVGQSTVDLESARRSESLRPSWTATAVGLERYAD